MEIVLLLLAVVGLLLVRKVDRDETLGALGRQAQELERLRDEIRALRQAGVTAQRTNETEPVAVSPAAATEVKENVPTAYPAAAMADYLVRPKVSPLAVPVVKPLDESLPVDFESESKVMPGPVIAPAPVPPPPPPPPPPLMPVAYAATPGGAPVRKSLEQTLGANWLNRLGIVLLVFGVALYLAYQVTHFGPLGKVLTAFGLSGVLLGGGLWLERREQYSMFGRAGIGGGWALGFLTTYAMYFFPATRVLTSQGFDLLLLFAVGAGMVLHSLRYRSQVVTGLAFLLAFSTVTISQVTAFSLLASAVLALGLEFVCVREAWYGLEIAGVVAAYGNHFLWLDRTLGQYGGLGHPFPLWGESTGLLLLFWAIFRVGYCVRRPVDEAAEGMSGLVAVLNSAGVLALMKYQSFHPEWGFWALLALGSVEMALAFWMRGRRRPAFVVLATIASVLLLAAVPLRYGGATWPLLWVVQGEALFLCGLWLKERVMRWLGVIAHLLVVGQMLALHGDVAAGAALPGAGLVAATYLCVATAMWANAEWLGRGEDDGDAWVAVLRASSGAAALCAVLGIWMLAPGWALVLCLAGMAAALVEVGLRAGSLGLRTQGYGVLAVMLARLVAFNLTQAGAPGVGDFRMWACLGAITACIAVQERLRLTGVAVRVEERLWIAEALTWCASAVAMWVLYLELSDIWLAEGWALLALLLVEIGVREKAFGRRVQGYFVMAAALVRVVAFNLTQPGAPGFGDARLWAGVGIVTACVLLQERLKHAVDVVAARERGVVAGVAIWCASALVSGLMYLELPEKWLAAGWAGFAAALAGLCLVRDSAKMRSKALLLAMMVVGRGLMVNLWGSDARPGTDWGRLAFFCAVSLLGLGVAIGLQLRRKVPVEKNWMGVLIQWPEQVFFFAALALLVAWVPVDFHKGALTMGWSALGVGAFLVALAVGERSFRLAGLGLLLVGVAKLLIVDVWGLAATERYLLLIAVGVALLLVSFLYSRFGERLKEYL